MKELFEKENAGMNVMCISRILFLFVLFFRMIQPQFAVRCSKTDTQRSALIKTVELLNGKCFACSIVLSRISPVPIMSGKEWSVLKFLRFISRWILAYI